MTDTAIDRPDQTASRSLLFVAGATAALFAANLYYAQPLLTTIARDLGLPPRFAGSVVSASQMGYGLGLFFLVPLSDIIENRRLVLTCSVLTLIGIIGVACSHSAMTFLFFALMIGIFSSGAQVLIPYLSHIIPEARRGRILGNVMAGILTTIMLARPFALFVAAAWGWRSVYFLSAFATAMLGIALWRTMPPRQPHEHIAYKRTIISMFVLFGSERRVRRRTMYQAILFACFTMFWAAIPILLAERFGFSKPEIGLFALVGAGGVMAAPVAGRIADRGAVWIGTVLSSVVVVAAFLCSGLSLYWAAPIALAVASLIIDGAIQISQMLSRIIVLDVAPAIRGRINALYMTTVYFSGAVGSMLGVSIYFSGGWWAVVMMGMLAGSAVFLAAMAERWSGLAGRTPASGGIDGVAGPETSGR